MGDFLIEGQYRYVQQPKGLGELFFDKCDEDSSKVAMVYHGVSFTYGDLKKTTEKLIQTFSDNGIHKGCHVGFCGPNSAGWAASFFALNHLGAVMILFNYKSVDKELVTTASSLKLTNLVKIDEEGEPHISSFPEGEIDKREHLPVLYFLTSGSSGTPKLIGATERQLIFSIDAIANMEKMRPGDSCCLVLPLNHIFGLGTLLPCLMVGVPLYIPASTRSKDVFSCLEGGRCTIINAVPTLMLALAHSEYLKDFDQSHLRTSTIGGASPSKAAMMDIFSALPGVSFLKLYGSSECAAVAHSMLDDSVPDILESVGKPLSDISIKIVDPESGQALEKGKPGEIYIKSDYLKYGDQSIVDGDSYFHTGDLGYLNQKGYLVYLSRKDEMINRAGEKVYPVEIRDALSALDGVEDAYVYGRNDYFLGDQIVALIEKGNQQLSEAEIKDRLREKLPSFKIPDRILFYEKFPLLPNGKLDKGKLLSLAEECIKNTESHPESR